MANYHDELSWRLAMDLQLRAALYFCDYKAVKSHF